jgi:hypothetical protein
VAVSWAVTIGPSAACGAFKLHVLMPYITALLEGTLCMHGLGTGLDPLFFLGCMPRWLTPWSTCSHNKTMPARVVNVM